MDFRIYAEKSFLQYEVPVKIYPISSSYGINAARTGSTKRIKNNSDLGNFSENIKLISFKGGDSIHDVKHGISVSVEDNIIGLPMYKCGGQGSVAAQLPEALNIHAGMNMKHIVPYYSYNNPTGGIKVLVIPESYDLKNLPDKMPENLFLTYDENKPLSEIAKELNVPAERLKYVVQDAPQSVKDAKTYIDRISGEIKQFKSSPYRILIPTDVSGSISRIDENSLSTLRAIPYRAYKMALPKADGGYDTESVICLHTKDFAKFEKAYTYSPELKDHPHLNLYTRDFCDASVDMMPKMNTKEFSHFKPSNIIAHCRTGFSTTESVINRSEKDTFYRGFNIVDIFHNPMENYQGASSNPLDFLRYKATSDDFMKLSKTDEFSRLVDIDSHRYNLNEEERKIVDKIIKPFLQYYTDDNGNYNHSITPLIARKANPENVFPNHVSHTFANEVILYDDIARGLTWKFREAANSGDKIPGRPNGCNIDFMRINDTNAKMGNNDLSKDLSWYHPYNTKVDTAEKIAEAKRANTKGFLDAVGKASKERADKLGDYANLSTEDKLNRLFFSKDDIAKNKYVLGGLSKFHEKDILWASWGRSDPQKGYPVLLEGFRKYLADETVPLEIRKHSKLMIGSGSEPWAVDDKGCGDFHKIKDTIYKIQNMAEGKFKYNVMYSNGGISNRLVTCATYTVFTSTGEPQGLTVPESLQSGTPSGSLNSGGAGEMIVTLNENFEHVNGFKTEHAYMQNLSELEKQKGVKISGETIHEVRLDAASDEVAKMFKDMALTYHNKPELYKKMVLNAARSEFDWHNNFVLNEGRSTVQLYSEDAFKIQKGWEERNTNPLKRLVGEFGGKFEELKRTAVDLAQTAQKAKEVVLKVVKPPQKRVTQPKAPKAKTVNIEVKPILDEQLLEQNKNLMNEVENYKQALKEVANTNKFLKTIVAGITAFIAAEGAIYLYSLKAGKIRDKFVNKLSDTNGQEQNNQIKRDYSILQSAPEKKFL